MSVRVRFAPSPTGFLHVGGLRTALYNFLFARRHGGKCILRIEDTDRTRLVENVADKLIESLKWAGVEFDEGPIQGGDCGPYTQSERLGLYKKYADILLATDSAYYAFDSSEEIAAMRERQQAEKLDLKYDRINMKNQLTIGEEKTKELIESRANYVVRLKVPENFDVQFKDIIRGEVTVNSKEIDDQVLMKSDGFPTYHLANVVDDYAMGITHVIRGEEWLPSTPKHVLLYDAFGWQKPQFAHLPLLLNKDKSKLSKRQGDVAVEDYIAKGYIKEAFVNFIALLGWNPTGDREIYEFQELIDLFILEKVNKGGAVFDLVKLDWMNAQYLRKMPET
ncbi:MAG: glutamate--tRNA ligase, partial [Ignavibacteria bacterium]|nr:glutamate--tRNA ligase [Ignavibacteria bacterium]